jgi:soluble lytic murein transglycosylase-like protein
MLNQVFIQELTMRRALLPLLFCFSISVQATDCFDMAGRDYKIDPDLLRAISWNESNFKVGVIGKNLTTGYGLSLMQIDSQNYPHLMQFGITPDQLASDPCMNIYTGAYYLAIALKRWGYNWEAVGAYNAGFAKNDIQNTKRMNYANKIFLTYHSMKKQRGNPLSRSQ